MHMSNDSVNALSKEVRDLIHEAEQLLNEAKTSSGEKAVALQKKGMELLACSISKAQELERQTVRSVQAVAASTNKLVQANPWRSVAVSGLFGAGIGLVLGIALSRD